MPPSHTTPKAQCSPLIRLSELQIEEEDLLASVAIGSSQNPAVGPVRHAPSLARVLPGKANAIGDQHGGT